MVSPVVMCGCESWTVKKAEHRRIDASELWCWRRLLRVLWTARRSSQSILKEISPGISLEGMMLKLKLQYFGHLMRRVDPLENTLGGIGGRRKRGRQRMRWLDGITDSMDVRVWVNSGSWWWTGRPGVLRFMGSQSQTRLSDWTKLKWNEDIVVVQLVSHVRHFVTAWTAAHLASLSFTISQSMPKLIHIGIVMPSNHFNSVIPFACLESFATSGSFPVSQFFVSRDQNIGASASASVLPMNIQSWFL